MYARMSALLVAFALITAGIPGTAAAQGVQTGTIRGVVVDQQNLAVPGVTVTATSPALQGSRTTVTDVDGTFTVPALPPGVYEVRYELSGFATVTQTSTVALGLSVDQNITMRTAAVTETVEVVAETPAPIATPVVGINVAKEEIDALATPRTIQGIATLAPALTERSPNTNQVVINGAFSFDNVFMVNGVDVNDNLFASPQNLFIEDAIQETQVLSSGISAEYGRFTGGVINAITKSGSNLFSGSYRLNLQNPAWSVETPRQTSLNQTNPDLLGKVHEGTFGGPILRDRIWFFVAGRQQASDAEQTLQETGLSVVRNDSSKRGEIKLTGTVAANHTIQGGFLNNPRTVTNDSGILSFAMEPQVLQTRRFPNHYYFTNYRGVLRGALVEAQYSQRKFRFDNSGGTDTNVINSSPFISATQCACLYRNPYFDGTDPTGRNNRQFSANTTMFWNGSGRHDTKVGYEWFRSQLVGGNSQSPTNYVFDVDFIEGASGAVLDANGRVQPNFVPGESYLEFFPAVKGATMNVNTNSFFVQDRWVLSPRISADLGVRFEQTKVISTGDIVSVNTSPRLVPRLGLSYDVRGNGSSVAHVTYGQYAGRYNEAQVGGNSPVGNPNYLPLYYQGPAGQGWAFAATTGMNLANYPIASANFAGTPSVPLANVFVDEKLKTPLVHEFTLSFGNTIGQRGFGEVSYVWRKTGSMVEDVIRPGDTTDVILTAGGQTLNLGTVSNIRYENSDIPRREYQAMIFQTRYRVLDSLQANAHYTLQLRNHGNYEGEGTNLPGNTSVIADYPEATSEDRHYPFGRLQNFQRHKVRAWMIYTQDLGWAGNVGLSGLWRVDSGGVYSLAQTRSATAIQNAATTAAGYPEGLGSRTVYFGGRGTEDFKGYGLFDTSVTYNIPVFRTVAPWLKFDVYNLFNNQKLIAWNNTISGVAAGPVDALGIPTTFTQGAAFGTATGNTQSNTNISGIPTYPQWSGGFNGGRTYRFAFGVRF
jgi:outer membrane receptor protein involved in Fe transport